MSLKATIQTIELLRKELDDLRPLKKEDEERLWKKFRLEWSYNSNHIEGNTLTYGETELLLIFGKTTGDHTLREYEEMKAHDIAVNWIREQAIEVDDRFNEGFIRELNRLILKEPFFKSAETLDGKETQKQIIPGDYKSSPNSVRLSTGEMFYYASPEETPAKMGDLVQWYRQAITDAQLHPVQIAAELHYKFVLIHPFDDGNGRVARLLMNYTLMRAGYPPIIIPTKDKKAYLDALNKVDTKVDTEAFAGYIAKQLIWSLELNLKAAKGEDIEEDDDLDKEIEVFKVSQKGSATVFSKTPKTIRLAYMNFVEVLFSKWIEESKKRFSELFTEIEVSSVVDNYDADYGMVRFRILMNPSLQEGFNKAEWLFLSKESKSVIDKLDNKDLHRLSSIGIKINLLGYNVSSAAPFSVNTYLEVSFNERCFDVKFQNKKFTELAYGIGKEDVKPMIKVFLKEVFETIQSKAKSTKI